MRVKGTLRGKCPNMEFFLVLIFLYLDSVFSPNTGKTHQKNLRIWTLFTKWYIGVLRRKVKKMLAWILEVCLIKEEILNNL